MSDTFDFNSRRSPVYSRKGIVAASQPLAVAAGLKILAQGGSAADAAIATAAALNVTEPTSTGLGGDAFALYFEASSKQVFALNGSGRAPQSLTLERVQREGYGGGLPPYHPYCVTVPGACAAWADLVERFGRLSLGDVLAPAVELAAGGFPVSPITSYFWKRGAQGQLARAYNGQELTIDRRGPEPGEIFRNAGLARTLETISSGGKDAYYRGEIGEAVAAAVQAAGGCLAAEDIAAHFSTWEEPVSVAYRGVRVWECPPNGQGLAALLALNILSGWDIANHVPLSPERLHLQIEALRLGFADALHYMADPAFRPAPLEGLLSEAYTAGRRAQVNPERALPTVSAGLPQASHDTVYLSVVDGEGNACSFINSNYMGFGTGIVPPGWGFSLQNRGHNFSLQPGHFNVLEPGKRPYHTIIPAMATQDGELYASFGVMGGFMQPQGHVQVLQGMVDDGLDPQAALDQLRFCIDPLDPGNPVSLEQGIPEGVQQRLAEMGHPVKMVGGMGRALFGRGQIIRRDPATGVLSAGSDPRADGLAGVL